jgi:hypothetical protein
VLLDDIRHPGEYEAALKAGGCAVRRVDSRIASTFLTLLTMGSLRPGTVVGRKVA